MIIDISHTYRDGESYRPGSPPVSIKSVKCVDESENIFQSTVLAMPVHAGTHLDVAKGIDIELERFISRGVMLDVQISAERQITLQNLKNRSRMQNGDTVIIRTGWSEFCCKEKYYKNPEITEEVVEWLISKRVNMVGIDAPGLAQGKTHSMIDRRLLAENIIIIENLTNLKVVEAVSFRIYCFPLKIENSDAYPARVLVEY